MFKFKFSVKVSLILVLSLFFVSSSVLAYNYWGSIAGFYKIESGVSSGYYHNFAVNEWVDGKNISMGTAFSSAFSIWMMDTNANLTPLPSGSTAKAKITSYSTSFPEKTALFGWATMYKNGSNVNALFGESAPTGSWEKAEVYLNKDTLAAKEYSYIETRAIAFHEIGHALGLTHFYSKPSIMDDTTSGGKPKMITKGWTIPQADDIDGVNNLYQ